MVNRTLIRDQVYEYLKNQMGLGHLTPGCIVNKKQIIEELKISQTPLREAFLQLQSDGFVEIIPQKGVIINKLSWKDVKDIYEIIRELESFILRTVFDNLKPTHINKLKRINEKMISYSSSKNDMKYHDENVKFHNVYLDLSDNLKAANLIKKQRKILFDFHRKKYDYGWKQANYNEHVVFIKLVEAKDKEEAIRYITTTHLTIKDIYLEVEE